MKEIITSKGAFVVDEVDSSEAATYMFFESPKIFKNGIYLKPMFLISDVTEKDAIKVVDGITFEDKEFGSYTKYRNYTAKTISPHGKLFGPISATDSLHSLLKSKGIDINNGNWYLFKKV